MANSELQKWICLTFCQNTADAETIWISRWPTPGFPYILIKGFPSDELMTYEVEKY